MLPPPRTHSTVICISSLSVIKTHGTIMLTPSDNPQASNGSAGSYLHSAAQKANLPSKCQLLASAVRNPAQWLDPFALYLLCTFILMRRTMLGLSLFH